MPMLPLRRRIATARRRRPVRPALGVEALEGRALLAIMVDVVDHTSLGSAGSIYMTGHGIPGDTPSGAAPLELRVVGASGGFVQGAATISTASCTGTTARITTSVDHEIVAGQDVYVSGVVEGGYCGVFTVTAVDTSPHPQWFEYAVSSTLLRSTGGAVYLPTLISSQSITAAKAVSNIVTITLSGVANIPLNSPIFISGLTGTGATWNGVQKVSQNPSSNPALTANQFQISVSGASGTAGLSAAAVKIVSLSPIALASLPKDPANGRPAIRLDGKIATFSAQLVPMVTPTGQSPYPLGIVPGTANLSNLGIPPFAVGQQAGTSVADILEFYYAGAGASTFDLSGVDGFALPLTLASSSVSSGPSQVGLNASLANLSRAQVGQAFTAFIGNEPADVKTTAQFGRLLYSGPTSTNQLTVAPASQPGTPLTGVSMARWHDPSSDVDTNIITCTTSGPHGLVPGQAITIQSSDPQYSGTYTVANTGLYPNSGPGGVQLTANKFTVNLKAVPASASASGTVTPTNSGVIATSAGNLVVEVTSGTPPAAGATVQLAGVPNGTFSASVNAPYTVLPMPADVGLPASAVLLTTTTGQTFGIGNSTGAGTLSTPVFVAPPFVPSGQFYVIAAPKDWLANQSVATANADPMVNWWDTTIDNFFKAGNYLQVAIGQPVASHSYTGIYNTGTKAFDFRLGTATSGTVAFSVAKPTPTGGQSQSLANATWVWGQAGIPSNAQGTVWDQIVQAFCRGVALDGVLTSAPTTASGQSNAAWTNTATWYTEHASTAFPGVTSVYCPFSKFLHYATLTGGTDRTGTSSMYLQNRAYGFSEDETPIGSNGQAVSTGVPSKMDGTVPDGATMTLTVNPWNGGVPQAPTVTSIDTNPPENPPGTPTPTTAASVTWIVAFNEPVSGVTPANFTIVPSSGLAGTSITSVVANGGGASSQTWTVTANTGSGTGTLGLNLTSAGSIEDASGTPLSLPGGSFTGQIYSVRPNPVGPTATIAIAGTTPTDAASVPFTVTFSAAVTGLTAANFTTVAGGGVTGAFVQGVSGSGTTWTITVNTGSGSGTLALRLATSTGITPAPTGLPVTSLPYTINKDVPTAPPTVQSIALAGTSPTSAASVSWTVTFSEPVTGLTTTNFALAASGLGGMPAITGVAPASTSNTATWTVTASTGTGSGTLGLNMVNSTNVHDADSQPVSDLPFTGSVYTIDRTAPAARSIVRANASPTSQSVVSWTVTFSEAVSGLSQQNFQLAASGLTNAQVTHVAPGVGSAPSATWTVTALTGSGSGTLRLDLVNARGITDAAGLPPTGIPLTGQAYRVERGGATTVDVPIAFLTTMGASTPLRWLMNPFTDSDSVQLTATLSASPGAAAGTFRAASGVGVTVSPSAAAASELTFSGTVAALNAYFRNVAGFITYTPAGSSLAPRTLTLSAQGSDGLSGFATAALLVRAAAPQTPAPAISPTATLSGTSGQPLVITYAQLVAATGATLTTSRSIQFMLAGLSSGRLEVWNGGRWIVVPTIPSIPLLAPGGRIRWTPPASAAGPRPAFSVKAWDGWRMSGVSQVAVNLAR